MELTETQYEIETAIRDICARNGFATISEVTDAVSVSKQTILTNIDTILQERGDIETKKVGQANVYQINSAPMDELWTDNTVSTYRLDSSSAAGYAELREAPEDSDFDYIVNWYDYEFKSLNDYVPTDEEMGQVMDGLASEPVAIKFYDESALNQKFVRVEDTEKLR